MDKNEMKNNNSIKEDEINSRKIIDFFKDVNKELKEIDNKSKEIEEQSLEFLQHLKKKDKSKKIR